MIKLALPTLILIFSSFGNSAYAISDEMLQNDLIPLILKIRKEPKVANRLQLLNSYHDELMDKINPPTLPNATTGDDQESSSSDDLNLPNRDPEELSILSLESNIEELLMKLTVPLSAKKCTNAKESLVLNNKLSIQQISYRKAPRETLVTYDLLKAVCNGID